MHNHSRFYINREYLVLLPIRLEDLEFLHEELIDAYFDLGVVISVNAALRLLGYDVAYLADYEGVRNSDSVNDAARVDDQNNHSDDSSSGDDDDDYHTHSVSHAAETSNIPIDPPLLGLTAPIATAAPVATSEKVAAGAGEETGGQAMTFEQLAAAEGYSSLGGETSISD